MDSRNFYIGSINIAGFSSIPGCCNFGRTTVCTNPISVAIVRAIAGEQYLFLNNRPAQIHADAIRAGVTKEEFTRLKAEHFR